LVVDVAKGSPLLSVCFFPFYFLRMSEYVPTIGLGDQRDGRLVLYQRDLGVRIFPVVRIIYFFVAISSRCMLSFVPSLTNAYDPKKKNKKEKVQ